ncbi:MAG: hypothetical protein OES53_00220 [Xanthomonadales bacterium]|nr:hypothetical protein [Xanthomonadales bacterium]MDH3925606.1 hypothetical protein [Xanthomonadales bacterium]MDH3939866.1 hypothetical protein [Xanthomonadales bacterium]MDH4000984.1 hypothetical protein [Xanthomonadales bacterium]
MQTKSNCPNCHNYTFPMWIKVFAMWPFMARCKNCGCKVRLKIPRWQNILFQILGQLAFWSILLAGLTAGGGNILVAASAGAVIALLIAIAPGIFAGLEATQ